MCVRVLGLAPREARVTTLEAHKMRCFLRGRPRMSLFGVTSVPFRPRSCSDLVFYHVLPNFGCCDALLFLSFATRISRNGFEEMSAIWQTVGQVCWCSLFVPTSGADPVGVCSKVDATRLLLQDRFEGNSLASKWHASRLTMVLS